jgi:hypothetical protein
MLWKKRFVRNDNDSNRAVGVNRMTVLKWIIKQVMRS